MLQCCEDQIFCAGQGNPLLSLCTGLTVFTLEIVWQTTSMTTYYSSCTYTHKTGRYSSSTCHITFSLRTSMHMLERFANMTRLSSSQCWHGSKGKYTSTVNIQSLPMFTSIRNSITNIVVILLTHSSSDTGNLFLSQHSFLTSGAQKGLKLKHNGPLAAPIRQVCIQHPHEHPIVTEYHSFWASSPMRACVPISKNVTHI